MPRSNKSIRGISLVKTWDLSKDCFFNVSESVLGTLGVCRVWGDISSHGLSLPSSTKCDPGVLSTATQLGTQPGPCSSEYQTPCTTSGNRSPPSPSYSQSLNSSLLPQSFRWCLSTVHTAEFQHPTPLTPRNPRVLVLFHQFQKCKPQLSSPIPEA